MKRFSLLWILTAIFAGPAIAADNVSLVFDQVSIMDLAKVAFGELSHEPVIFTSDAMKAPETVSLTLREVDRRQAIDQVGELLTRTGYSAERHAGVVWIDKVKPAQESELYYRPRFRSVSYLVDLMAPLFKTGSFTLQRGVSQSPAATLQPQQQQADSGNSAFSQLDKNPDAFIFRGTDPDRTRLKDLLGQVDIATPEILVKAVVFEVSTDSADQSAFSLAAQLLGGKLGITLGNAAAGDYSVLFKGASFQAVFNALSSDRRFKAVSSPQLRVQSGSSAQLTVGSDTPVLGAVSYDNNGKAVQSVEYKSSGVILNLKPQIRQDAADLQISQQISNFIQTTTGVNNSPTLIKRELQTTVGIKSDDVLILGGLDQDSDTSEKQGVSFLPAWLSSKSSGHSKTEVLLILQATRI